MVAAASGVFVILRTKRSSRHFLALFPGLLIICGWRFYLSAMHAPQAADFLPMNLETFSSHLHRVLPLFSALWAEYHNLPTWSLLWIVVAVGVAYLPVEMRNPYAPVMLTATSFPIMLHSPI